MAETLKNSYKGKTKEWLLSNGVEVWSKVKITTEKGVFQGLVLPRGEQGDDKHLVIKIASGYNIGILVDNITEIEIIEKIKADYKVSKRTVEHDPEKPTIVLLGTGGTIAAKLDYKTGAVIPAFSPQELFNAVPELEKICNIETKRVFQLLSENIEVENWKSLAHEIADTIDKKDPTGIVIAHGTDTLHYTAAALSFMIKNLDRPVVLTGAQRSSDRPSSDAAINLLTSCKAAVEADIAEVLVCMHGTSGDDYNYLHRGTRVRKMHTSRRDAFKSIGEKPLAKIKENSFEILNTKFHNRSAKRGKIELDLDMNQNVGLLYSYPGMKVELLEYFIEKEYSGVIIAGTGLGHINQKFIPVIEKATEKDIPVFMTSQCLWGYTGLNVYETGRKLLNAGVIPLKNMLPEVALVKAMWVLGHTDEIPFVKELMNTNLAGEITDCEPYDGYLIYQEKLKND